MIGIYKITSPTNKIYIGQSINIERRFRTYKSMSKGTKTSVKLYRSFLKYGVINHAFEAICECEINELNDKERYYQELFNCVKNGLNCILTNATGKRKITQPISDKQKLQISKVHKGKVLSEETIKKIKAARANQIITQEHKDNISKNSKSARIVLDINTGVFYNSVKEIADLYKIKANTLVCRLIGKVTNTTSFRYV